MNQLRKLTMADLGWTAFAFLLATAVEIGLRTMRLPRLARTMGVPLLVDQSPHNPGAATPTSFPGWARRRLAASRRALRHWPFGDTCLRKALVGGAMIRSLHPALRIGVAKHDGEFKAHAWIEIAGVSLDPGSQDFATVESV